MKMRLMVSTLFFLFSTLHADIPPPESELVSKQGMNALSPTDPSSRFQVERGLNLFLDVEFLWWVARADDLYFAQHGLQGQTTAVPPNGTLDFQGQLEKVKPHWDAGCRVGFGGNMPYDEWDLFFNWTFYRTDAKHSEHEGLIVLWGHLDADTANFASFASGRYELAMNLFDAELGRSFWVGERLSLRPFFSIRGAWIDQSFKIRYDYATTPTVVGKLKANSDFEGGGARAGVGARFSLLKGWSLYGLAAYSLLYGRFDCDFRVRDDHTTIAVTNDEFHQGTSTTQIALGVQWDTYCHRNRYHIGLYAGWEQNIWYNLVKWNHYKYQLRYGILEQTNGNLSLQGGTFGLRFDF